ncbi:acyl carrier protein [Streptomyces boninensis]|uniref:acyl carrier protein n=1 Tax=Streptomyces boninensis TaxID=2039455 RepID=UPI003B223DF2
MSETRTAADIVATVTDLIATEFGRPAAELTPDLDLTAVEGADSVKVLRAVARIEREFDVELEDDQVFGFKTVRDVAGAVSGLLGRQG